MPDKPGGGGGGNRPPDPAGTPGARPGGKMRTRVLAAVAGTAILVSGFGGGLAASAALTQTVRRNYVQVTHPKAGGGSITQAWNCANEGHPARHFWWFRNCRKA